jgi:hypothetical protein
MKICSVFVKMKKICSMLHNSIGLFGSTEGKKNIIIEGEDKRR